MRGKHDSIESVRTTERMKSSSCSINALPREILYYILSLCNQTYDIVNEATNCHGGRCLIINHGSSSRNFIRVCRLWKVVIEAGMVPATPFSEIQLTDEQFYKVIAEQRIPSLAGSSVASASTLNLSNLQDYKTITIICRQHDLGESPKYTSSPLEEAVFVQIPAPKQLNIVIVGGRAADIRPIFKHFKASHENIHHNFHEQNLASQETIEKLNNISIIIWNGRIIPSSSNEFVPALEIPSGLSRADLYINHWTDISKVDDIPWVFGQLCRNARPHTLGFHLLSPRGSEITDKWRMQKPCMYSDNTLLRKIHVTGISSDGFLRLVQCSRIEIWCVRELKITLPTSGPPELCYWDFRLFDKTSWPYTPEQTSDDSWGFPDDDLQDFLTFPKLALKRLVGGKIIEVEKERMDVPCQISSQHELGGLILWGFLDETDIESYAGRSLRWTSLSLVEVEGGLTGDARQGFESLKSQHPPRLAILG